MTTNLKELDETAWKSVCWCLNEEILQLLLKEKPQVSFIRHVLRLCYRIHLTIIIITLSWIATDSAACVSLFYCFLHAQVTSNMQNVVLDIIRICAIEQIISDTLEISICVTLMKRAQKLSQYSLIPSHLSRYDCCLCELSTFSQVIKCLLVKCALDNVKLFSFQMIHVRLGTILDLKKPFGNSSNGQICSLYQFCGGGNRDESGEYAFFRTVWAA